MDAFDLTRIVPLALFVWQLNEEPVLHQVLTAIADTEEQAAARAIEDAAASGSQREHVLSTITLLRSAYEKYLMRARNKAPSVTDRVRAGFHKDAAYRARYKAALTALTLAHAYRAIADWSQVAVWQERARDDFLASYEQIIPLRPSGLPDVVVGSMVSHVTAADRAKHQEKIAQLRHTFEDAVKALARPT